MRLVIITQRYDSSAINRKVHPTPLDAEGNPKYAIYLSDERAQALIDAGVAEEYVIEDLIVDNSNDDVVTDSDVTDNDVNIDDDNLVVDDSNKNESEESIPKANSKSNSKKNKSSK